MNSLEVTSKMATVNHEKAIKFVKEQVGTERFNDGIHGVKYEGTTTRDYFDDEIGTGTVIKVQVSCSDVNIGNFRKAGLRPISVEYLEELEQYEIHIGLDDEKFEEFEG